MRIPPFVICATLLCGIAPASAAPIQISFGEGHESYGAEWAPDFARIFDAFEDAYVDGRHVDDVLVTVSLIGAVFQGREIADDSDGIVNTTSRYSGGMLHAEALWNAPDGSSVAGSFQASIRELVFDVGSRWDDRIVIGDIYLTLGRGSMDASLAGFLGVASRSIRGGTYWMGMDYVEEFWQPQPDWALQGDWNGSDLDITVPEPATLMLLAIAGCAHAARRGRVSQPRGKRK